MTKKQRITIGGLIVVILTVVGLGLLWFLSKNRMAVMELSDRYLKNETEQKVAEISKITEDRITFNNSLAIVYGEKTQNGNAVNFRALRSAEESSIFDRVGFVTPKGDYYTSGGFITNVSDREYFRNGMEGKSGYLSIYGAKGFDENVLCYYAPIYSNAGIKGIFVSFSRTDTMKQDLRSQYCGYDLESVVFNEEGEIFASSGHLTENYTNVLDFLIDKEAINAADKDYIIKKISEDDSVSLSYQDQDGDNLCHIVSSPIDSMYFMIVFPGAISGELQRGVNKSGLLLEISVAIFFVGVIVYLILTSIKARRKILKKAEEASYVATGMRKLFERFTLLNLEEDTYEYLMETGPKNEFMPKIGNFSDLMLHLRTYMSDGDESKVAREHLDRDRLIAALPEGIDEVRFTYSLKDEPNTWESLVIACIERKDGVPTKLFMTRMDMTDIKHQEAESRRHLNVISALSSEYECIYLVYTDSSMYKIYRLNESAARDFERYFQFTFFEDILNAYKNQWVYEDDVKLFEENASLEKIQEAVKNFGSYHFNFRLNRSGKVEYYQMHVVGVNEDASQIIVGFKSVDEEIRHEEEQRDKLREALFHDALFKRAIYADALAYFEVNLTKDEIEGEVISIRDGREFPLGKRIGLKKPYKYSEFCRIWKEEMITPEQDIDTTVFDRDSLIDNYRNGNLMVESEYWTKNVANGLICVKEVFYLIQDDADDIYGMAIARDITDAVRSREEQRRNEEIVKTLSSDYSSAYYVNLDTDRWIPYIVADSSDDRRKVGVSSDAPFSETYKDFVEAHVFPDDRRELIRATRIDIIKKMLAGKRSFTKSFRSDITGTLRYYEMKVVKIGNEKEVREVVIGFVDKNDDIRREKEELQRLEIIQGLSSDYVCIGLIDPEDGTWNLFQLKNVAPSVARVLIQPMYKDIQNEYSKYVNAELLDEYINMSSIDTILENLTKSERYVFSFQRNMEGDSQFFQIAYHKAFNADGKTRIVMAVMPYTDFINKEIKQQELLKEALADAEKANNAKTSFLSSMSHDIRTPMNAIMGFTDSAKRHIKDEDRVLDCLDKISVSSGHLLMLINEVLDMSRIENGKLVINDSNVDIVRTLREVEAVMQVEADKKSQKFTVDTRGIYDKYVICDESRLKRVLTNIIGNAVKFTPNNGSIDVMASQSKGAVSDYVNYEIHVRDNGIGISDDFKEHIFEAFTREETATVSGIIGTGLGMTITKSIVEAMGGTIEVQSEKGVGSEFIIRLPLKLQSAADQMIASEAENGAGSEKTVRRFPEPKDREKWRVLVVEDNELNREIVTEIVSDFGFDVLTAMDGQEAIEAVEDHDSDFFDVVFMDIQMPRMNGYEAVTAIRKMSDKQKANVPVIAMTANAFEEDRRQVFACGMDGYIPKPIDVERLRNILIDILDKKVKTL